jgi:hypothetical protein
VSGRTCNIKTPPMRVLYWYTDPMSSDENLSPLYHCGAKKVNSKDTGDE